MKNIMIPTRMFTFLNNILDTLVSEGNVDSAQSVNKERLNSQQDRQKRKDFFLYKQVTDCETLEVVGQLADISSGGFKLDSLNPVAPNKDFHFHINLDSEFTDKPSMEFTARSRWCSVDSSDPYLYNVGYQLIGMAACDLEIFNRMMEKYGREPRNKYRQRPGSNTW